MDPDTMERALRDYTTMYREAREHADLAEQKVEHLEAELRCAQREIGALKYDVLRARELKEGAEASVNWQMAKTHRLEEILSGLLKTIEASPTGFVTLDELRAAQRAMGLSDLHFPT